MLKGKKEPLINLDEFLSSLNKHVICESSDHRFL